MKIKQYGIYIKMFFLIAILTGCATAPPPKIQTWNYSEYQSQSNKVQVKKGLTVEVEPMTPRRDFLKKYPELFSFNPDKMPDRWQYRLEQVFYPANLQGEHWIYTFGFGNKMLVAMKVKIKNETGHILRMKDARVYLRVKGQDPVKAVKRLGNPRLAKTLVDAKEVLLPQSYISRDDSLVDLVTQYEYEWENNRQKHFLELDYPIGTVSQVIAQNIRNYKLINDVDLEILPDDTYSGILLFPMFASDDEIELKMYDLTTETDSAGNATEKVTFTFKYNLNIGQMWYDRNNKTWVDGQASPEPTM